MRLVKDTINKVKRQHSKWEKIIAPETTDKGLISAKYTSSSCNSIPERKKNLIKKWVENLIRHFSKEDIQMVSFRMGEAKEWVQNGIRRL